MASWFDVDDKTKHLRVAVIVQHNPAHVIASENPPGQQLSKTIRPWLAINDQIGWILGTEKAVRIGLLKLTMAYLISAVWTARRSLGLAPFQRTKMIGRFQLPSQQQPVWPVYIYTYIYTYHYNYIYSITYDVYLLLEGKKVHGANGSVRSQLSWSRLLSSNSKIFALIRGFPNSSHTEESCPAIRLRLIRVTGVTGVTLRESLHPLHDFIHILVGQGIYQPHFQIWLFQILSQGPIIASW